MPQYSGSYEPVYQCKTPYPHPKIDMILVDTDKKYRTMVKLWKKSSKVVGFDTETTGLNHTTVDLVGCSLAFDKSYAFYLPFGHQVVDGSPNLPLKYFEMLNILLNKSKRVLYWNKKFDKRIRRAFGHKNINSQGDCDLQSWVYNWDTNIGMPALKPSTKTIMGWDMPSFTEKFGKNANLAFYRPKEVLEYAGYDAVLLLHLLEVVEEKFTDRNDFILQLDETSIDIISSIEETPMPLDHNILEGLKVEFEAKLKVLGEKINTLAKQKLNPESPKQVSAFFIANRLDTGEKTKKGNMACGAKQLEKIKNKHPIIPMISTHREWRKLIGTYLKPLADAKNPRFAYKTCQASTGRLSGGADKKNEFFTHVNIQGIPKAHSQDYLACHENSETFYLIKQSGKCQPNFQREVERWFFFPFDYDKKTGIRSIGDLIIGEDLEGYITEGFSPTANVRRAFVSRKDDYFVHFDYSAQELRIPTNFSKDKVMTEAFLAGVDPHRNTACMMFGEENYNGDLRKIAKILNFNLLYGGQKYSIAEKLGVSPNKAQGYIDKWWNLNAGIKRWRDKTIKSGMTNGLVKTAFKRVRRVSYYMNHPTYSMQKFGERTCVNTRVQGTGGDIIRIALSRAIKSGLHDLTTSMILYIVHDEINFSVKRDKLLQTLPVIYQAMDIKKPSWEVPMDLGVAIGFSWGEMWEFDFIDGKLIPNGKLITKG